MDAQQDGEVDTTPTGHVSKISAQSLQQHNYCLYNLAWFENIEPLMPYP